MGRMGTGFGDGFLKGMAIVDTFKGMIDKEKEKKEISEVNSAKAETSTGFTDADGAKLEALGKDGYKIDFDAANNAYVATKGDDTQTVAMRGVTDFLGQRYEGELDNDKQRELRQYAVADVIAKRDPSRGLAMRSDIVNAGYRSQQMRREQDAWAREDAQRKSYEEIDGNLTKEFQAGLVGADGKPRQPTIDDTLGLTQRRAIAFSQAGHMDKAGELFKEHAAQSHVKIQMETEQRDKALGETMAGIAAGDYTPTIGFLNRYVPTGSTFTGIEAGKDGSLVLRRTGIDGQPMEPLKATQEDMQNMLLSAKNPAHLYQFSQQQFSQQLQLRQDRRAAAADGRAAAQHGAAMEKAAYEKQQRESVPAAIDGLSKEGRFTESQLKAVQAGLVQKPSLAELTGRGTGGRSGSSGSSGRAGGDYKYDPAFINKAFGKTEVHPLTGKEVTTIDTEALKKFETWAADHPEMTDQNELLREYVNYRQVGEKRAAQELAVRVANVKQVIAQMDTDATPEALAYTAKARNMSVQEVLQELARKKEEVMAEAQAPVK